MYYEGTVATDIYKLNVQRDERKAALKWRTRHMKTKEAQVLTAALTNVLRLFVR
jgi:hypothetical protein